MWAERDEQYIAKLRANSVQQYNRASAVVNGRTGYPSIGDTGNVKDMEKNLPPLKELLAEYDWLRQENERLRLENQRFRRAFEIRLPDNVDPSLVTMMWQYRNPSYPPPLVPGQRRLSTDILARNPTTSASPGFAIRPPVPSRTLEFPDQNVPSRTLERSSSTAAPPLRHPPGPWGVPPIREGLQPGWPPASHRALASSDHIRFTCRCPQCRPLFHTLGNGPPVAIPRGPEPTSGYISRPMAASYAGNLSQPQIPAPQPGYSQQRLPSHSTVEFPSSGIPPQYGSFPDYRHAVKQSVPGLRLRLPAAVEAVRIPSGPESAATEWSHPQWYRPRETAGYFSPLSSSRPPYLSPPDLVPSAGLPAAVHWSDQRNLAVIRSTGNDRPESSSSSLRDLLNSEPMSVGARMTDRDIVSSGSWPQPPLRPFSDPPTTVVTCSGNSVPSLTTTDANVAGNPASIRAEEIGEIDILAKATEGLFSPCDGEEFVTEDETNTDQFDDDPTLNPVSQQTVETQWQLYAADSPSGNVYVGVGDSVPPSVRLVETGSYTQPILQDASAPVACTAAEQYSGSGPLISTGIGHSNEVNNNGDDIVVSETVIVGSDVSLAAAQAHPNDVSDISTSAALSASSTVVTETVNAELNSVLIAAAQDFESSFGNSVDDRTEKFAAEDTGTEATHRSPAGIAPEESSYKITFTENDLYEMVDKVENMDTPVDRAHLGKRPADASDQLPSAKRWRSFPQLDQEDVRSSDEGVVYHVPETSCIDSEVEISIAEEEQCLPCVSASPNPSEGDRLAPPENSPHSIDYNFQYADRCGTHSQAITEESMGGCETSDMDTGQIISQALCSVNLHPDEYDAQVDDGFDRHSPTMESGNDSDFDNEQKRSHLLPSCTEHSLLLGHYNMQSNNKDVTCAQENVSDTHAIESPSCEADIGKTATQTLPSSSEHSLLLDHCNTHSNNKHVTFSQENTIEHFVESHESETYIGKTATETVYSESPNSSHHNDSTVYNSTSSQENDSTETCSAEMDTGKILSQTVGPDSSQENDFVETLNRSDMDIGPILSPVDGQMLCSVSDCSIANTLTVSSCTVAMAGDTGTPVHTSLPANVTCTCPLLTSTVITTDSHISPVCVTTVPCEADTAFESAYSESSDPPSLSPQPECHEVTTGTDFVPVESECTDTDGEEPGSLSESECVTKAVIAQDTPISPVEVVNTPILPVQLTHTVKGASTPTHTDCLVANVNTPATSALSMHSHPSVNNPNTLLSESASSKIADNAIVSAVYSTKPMADGAANFILNSGFTPLANVDHRTAMPLSECPVMTDDLNSLSMSECHTTITTVTTTHFPQHSRNVGKMNGNSKPVWPDIVTNLELLSAATSDVSLCSEKPGHWSMSGRERPDNGAGRNCFDFLLGLTTRETSGGLLSERANCDSDVCLSSAVNGYKSEVPSDCTRASSVFTDSTSHRQNSMMVPADWLPQTFPAVSSTRTQFRPSGNECVAHGQCSVDPGQHSGWFSHSERAINTPSTIPELTRFMPYVETHTASQVPPVLEVCSSSVQHTAETGQGLDLSSHSVPSPLPPYSASVKLHYYGNKSPSGSCADEPFYSNPSCSGTVGDRMVNSSVAASTGFSSAEKYDSFGSSSRAVEFPTQTIMSSVGWTPQRNDGTLYPANYREGTLETLDSGQTESPGMFTPTSRVSSSSDDFRHDRTYHDPGGMVKSFPCSSDGVKNVKNEALRNVRSLYVDLCASARQNCARVGSVSEPAQKDGVPAFHIGASARQNCAHVCGASEPALKPRASSFDMGASARHGGVHDSFAAADAQNSRTASVDDCATSQKNSVYDSLSVSHTLHSVPTKSHQQRFYKKLLQQ